MIPPDFENSILEDNLEKVYKHLQGPPSLSLDVRNKQSETPFMIACKNQSKKSIKILTDDPKWTNFIEATDTNKRSALHFACEFGCTEFAIQLIQNGAKINAETEKSQTPLHLASENGHLKIVKHLVKRKADIEAKDKYGWTPLLLASKNGHLEIVKHLREKEQIGQLKTRQVKILFKVQH